MINDKVFLIFWWWLIFIIVAGTSRLVFRLFQVKWDLDRANIFNRTKKAFLGQELSAFKWLIYAWTDILEDHLRKSIKLKPISSSANWEIGKCLWRVINWLIKKTSSYRFVLYQLSKNLNRPFFMEFLTKISVEYDRDFDKDEEPLLGGTVLIEAKYQVYCVNLWPKIF